MIYPFSLTQVGLVVGVFLIVIHAVALANPVGTARFLRAFPRSVLNGRILLVLAAAWSYWLVGVADLGEFSHLKPMLQIAVPVGAVLAWIFVDEFLSVRALGTLALLAAEPVLSAAYLQEPISRLLIVALAYVWILIGLFLVGMPYLLRDAVAWITARAGIFRLAAVAGLFYGVLLIACSFLFWR